MKNVLITGGGGFLGQRVARALLAANACESITLLDIAAPPNGVTDPRVKFVSGEVSDAATVRAAVGDACDGVFHLAAVVSGAAEADFDLGMRVNLDGTRTVLDACRAAGRKPRFLFASSIAVFGVPLPKVVTDSTTPTPQASYGVQKLIGEWLVADYHRKGFIDGRAVRIPTVSVRPGKANAAASSFASAVIREPLNGIDYACPVGPETAMWVASPRTVAANLLRAFNLESEKLGNLRSLNLPGVVVTVSEMLAALKAQAGEKVASRVSFVSDARIEAIVATWAAHFDTARALSLGFEAGPQMDGIVREYIADEGIKV